MQYKHKQIESSAYSDSQSDTPPPCCRRVNRKIADKLARLRVHRKRIRFILPLRIEQPYRIQRILCTRILQANTLCLRRNGRIAPHRIGKYRTRTAGDAFIGPLDTLLLGYIILIGQITGKICRLKIDSINAFGMRLEPSTGTRSKPTEPARTME